MSAFATAARKTHSSSQSVTIVVLREELFICLVATLSGVRVVAARRLHVIVFMMRDRGLPRIAGVADGWTSEFIEMMAGWAEGPVRLGSGSLSSIEGMTTISITSIQRGIVFLMATWSGGAQWSFPKLAAFLKQHDIPSEQLHVLDVDEHPELNDVPELVGKIHGWGEALVVKDGGIVFSTCLCKDQHLIQERCDELLRVFTA